MLYPLEDSLVKMEHCIESAFSTLFHLHLDLSLCLPLPPFLLQQPLYVAVCSFLRSSFGCDDNWLAVTKLHDHLFALFVRRLYVQTSKTGCHACLVIRSYFACSTIIWVWGKMILEWTLFTNLIFHRLICTYFSFTLNPSHKTLLYFEIYICPVLSTTHIWEL